MKRAVRLEPPDGGWGILVCVGMALPFVSIAVAFAPAKPPFQLYETFQISGFAALPSFGLIFGDFLKSIGAETKEIGFITSAFFCSFSFAGLFSGSLFNRYGLRAVGLLGGWLYFIGNVIQIFVTSTLGLTIAFSLVQGTGFGLIVPTSYTTFNNYFVKKRIMWMSFAQSIIGLGYMFYPVLMQKLLEWYGFRGCLAILAAINSHAVLGMLLMHPVEWHMRSVPVSSQELQPLESTAQKTDQPAQVVEIVSERKDNNFLVVSASGTPQRKLSSHLIEKISSRSSSIASLGNWSGPMVVSDASPEMINIIGSRRASTIASVKSQTTVVEQVVKRSTWQIIVDFLDLTLLKLPIYVNIVLGLSFALYSDVAFFTLQPLYLFELDFDKAATARIIAIGAATDLASRIFLAVLAVFLQVPSRYIYLAGAFFTVLTRFAFLAVSDFTGMAVVTAILGFLRTWIHVPLPLIFAEYLPKERFATGYGLFMFLQGNITFAIGPIVGYLRDLTRDYVVTFHVVNFFMALCVVPWILEIIILKFRRRSKPNPSANCN